MVGTHVCCSACYWGRNCNMVHVVNTAMTNVAACPCPAVMMEPIHVFGSSRFRLVHERSYGTICVSTPFGLMRFNLFIVFGLPRYHLGFLVPGFPFTHVCYAISPILSRIPHMSAARPSAPLALRSYVMFRRPHVVDSATLRPRERTSWSTST